MRHSKILMKISFTTAKLALRARNLEESLLQEREPLTRFQGLKKVRKKRLLG
jgi:hypothetical protein